MLASVLDWDRHAAFGWRRCVATHSWTFWRWTHSVASSTVSNCGLGARKAHRKHTEHSQSNSWNLVCCMQCFRASCFWCIFRPVYIESLSMLPIAAHASCFAVSTSYCKSNRGSTREACAYLRGCGRPHEILAVEFKTRTFQQFNSKIPWDSCPIHSLTYLPHWHLLKFLTISWKRCRHGQVNNFNAEHGACMLTKTCKATWTRQKPWMTSFGMPSAWPFAVLVPSQDPSLKNRQKGTWKISKSWKHGHIGHSYIQNTIYIYNTLYTCTHYFIFWYTMFSEHQNSQDVKRSKWVTET